MQTSKSRPGSLEMPHNPSPTAPRTTWKLKTLGSESGSVSSPNPASKTPKDKSPKVVARRLSRSPATEKKGSSRVSELELQLAHLHEELKKTKDQLSSSESWKTRAQQEAEEAKKQFAAMSAKLEETRKQLNELSDSEEARVQELRKISQDRDRAWQSELEAVQKQHSMDSAALASAMNEIHRLKIQLDRGSESEASQARHAENQSLRFELTETLDLVEKLKNQLNDSRDFEAQALEEVSRVQMQLDALKTTEEMLQLEHANAMESYKSLLLELEESKNKVNSLEELVCNLQVDLTNSSKISANPSDDAKISSENGEDDETELEIELKKSESVLENLNSRLLDKESRLQSITEENEMLKSEILRRKMEKSKANDEALALAEAARATEREALMKLGYVTEEADKSCRKAARVTEQLDAAQAANLEMEAELRRLKVQSDQWRKAAEAAAAMLSNGYNGKYIAITGSVDYNTIGGKLGSPYSEDTDDDSPKKKNGNMLKKIGVLLKKGQK